ncbi:NADH-quinone oxidoreductase subunit E [Belnapia sp. T6]|uniref:NADH-quinone oxidoreductase subunit E n=1 Tax=Belnapia mucosa TaxID=2804532 RepID=A0ABS1V3Z6_9PROT|nr:proton-conducting transporter membrane subunit [Belnapia mucosa]MBL6456422.1 NADH-quinone oxidoreductase subunit E [Belnapia mucosa]
MSGETLLPLAVALPLLGAALLLALGHVIPKRASDMVALLLALALAGIGAWLAREAAAGPVTHWFGGWVPQGGRPLGIAFTADLAGAGMVCFIGLVFAACFAFAWGYFEPAGAMFHVLMLVFMGAMAGFCLTADLFNLFVWFEVMSVAAFALTAYHLESSAIEGALNFTITNSLASFMMLGGIGLLYARFGLLDMPALGRAAAEAPGEMVVAAACCLLLAALLTKAAMVPFQFWLTDAHAVAPSPVSVVFSGVMVSLGIFGIARLGGTVFAGVPAAQGVMHGLLLGLGLASALLGGVGCLQQRHLKRMLAFSTISHTGILLGALALVSAQGKAGMLAYLLGHGAVKAALFMIAGILLTRCGGIDEIQLRGRGRAVWPAGIVFGLAGLVLGGLPFGTLDEATRLLDSAAAEQGLPWLAAPLLLGAALTGGAVLRAGGRIFLGWGRVSGEEERAPTEEEQEPRDRPLWLMLAPAAVLLAAALGLGGPIAHFALTAAGGGEMPAETPNPWLPWAAIGLSLLIAGWDLGRAHLPRWLRAPVEAASGPAFALLDRLHTGRVGDYVAFMLAGLAVLTLGFMLG